MLRISQLPLSSKGTTGKLGFLPTTLFCFKFFVSLSPTDFTHLAASVDDDVGISSA